MSGTRLIPFEHGHLKSYQNFAERQFGAGCYQAKADYLQWLYLERPSSMDHRDFTIAVTDADEVVGCIHKMRLPWSSGGEITDVPAVHNLVVDERHRHGMGLKLILASVAGEEHALMPGVARNTTELFQKLKYQRVAPRWYRKVLRPLHGAAIYAARKCLNRDFRRRQLETADRGRPELPGLEVSAMPDAALLERLSESMNAMGCSVWSPHWTADLVRWRFFHPRGPRHLLVYKLGHGPLDTFAVISLGIRHHLNLGRILALRSRSTAELQRLMAGVERILRWREGHLLQFICGDDAINAMLQGAGWTPMDRQPDTFLYHRNRKEPFAGTSFFGGAGDYGFEAMS